MTRGRYRWTLTVVAVSAFMVTLDNTVITVALDAITRDLRTTDSTARWSITGYIVMFSCLMIAGGRLTDIYGARLTFVSGMSIFTGASLAAGLAQTDTALIISRVVQGSGAALALPATLVIVTVGRTDKQKSIGMIAYLAATSISLAIGPLVGGFIVERWHWGWIFLINIVPGVAVILLGLVVLQDRRVDMSTRVDLPGVLTSATTLFTFTYGLEAGSHLGWAHPSVLSVFALAVIAGASFVLVEWWAPDPMIDLNFFRNRVFTGGIIAQMLWGVGFNGVMVYAALYLQRVLGFAPTQTGLVFLPPAIVLLLMTPVSFWLAARIGPKLTIGGGMTVMAASMAIFATLQPGDTYPDLMPGVFVLGIGAALSMPLAMYVLKAVPEDRAGVASGILNVVREFSGAFGVAILGTVIDVLNKSALASGHNEIEAFRQAATIGLLFGGAMVLVGAIISAWTLPRKRDEPRKAGVKVDARDRSMSEESITAGSARRDRSEPEHSTGDRVPVPVGAGGPEEPDDDPEAPPVRVSWVEHAMPNGTGLWPPPPSGWYSPYDPEDDAEPAETYRRPRLRRDAW